MATVITLDQTKLLDELHERFPDHRFEELAQVFVIDVWYILELADAVGDTRQEYNVALIAMLIYQLATAATLTDGTLPVYAAFSSGSASITKASQLQRAA